MHFFFCFFALDISTREMKSPNCREIQVLYRQRSTNKRPSLSSPPHPTMTPHTSVYQVGKLYLFQSAESNVSLEGGRGGAYLSLYVPKTGKTELLSHCLQRNASQPLKDTKWACSSEGSDTFLHYYDSKMVNEITFLKYYEVLCFKLDLKLSNSSFL